MEVEVEMEVGKVFDVVSLFKGKQRDFLVNNSGEKVKIESLKGKVVAIFFLSLEVAESSEVFPFFEREVNRPIKLVYDYLSPQNNFEVVLVADVYDGDESEDKKFFDNFFSGMPWLAIPQDDKESRRELFSMIDIDSELRPLCTILDDKGKVVNLDAIQDFCVFGPECYPFTPERIVEIRKDDILARAAMSVKRLLTTPTRDYLIRSNSEKVPVSHLEGKVVAFYFYIGYETRIVDKLINLYKKLLRMRKNFEIVFINSLPTEYENLFMETFNRTPWLGLPSNDRSYFKLMRIFLCTLGQLVIVCPGAKFPDIYGLEVIDHYGIKAYPFTRQRVTEMEVERLESLTLESILFSGRCKYNIEGNSGQKITAHHLMNKTILLLFTRRSCSNCHRLMPRLVTWYNETKKTAKEDFEIIHIPYDYDPAKKCYYGTMPWLQFPYDAKYNQKLFRETLSLPWGLPVIIAFGADGKIRTREVHYDFLSEEWESKIEYPVTFTNVDFYLEVDRRVAFEMSWPAWSYVCAELQRQGYDEQVAMVDT